MVFNVIFISVSNYAGGSPLVVFGIMDYVKMVCASRGQSYRHHLTQRGQSLVHTNKFYYAQLS